MSPYGDFVNMHLSPEEPGERQRLMRKFRSGRLQSHVADWAVRPVSDSRGERALRRANYRLAADPKGRWHKSVGDRAGTHDHDAPPAGLAVASQRHEEWRT